MSAGYIQKEPDPSHAPEKGDQYISRVYGITVTVVAVGNKDGKRWVVWETAQRVKYKSEYEHFVTTSRRVIPRGIQRKRGRRR